jgi:uncharacterized membrane protein YuzA (DUF378 family)
MHKVTFILLIIGGVNWLLEVFGTGLGYWLPANLANLVYVLVGLSAIYEIFTHRNICRHCVPERRSANPIV